jgi:hypothetical protein
MDSFHGSHFTQQHFYLIFYSKLANNTLVYTAIDRTYPNTDRAVGPVFKPPLDASLSIHRPF